LLSGEKGIEIMILINQDLSLILLALFGFGRIEPRSSHSLVYGRWVPGTGTRWSFSKKIALPSVE
jgi:hypothetical protein